MSWSRGMGVLLCTVVGACSEPPHAPIYSPPPVVQAPGKFRIGPDTLDLYPGELRNLGATWTGTGSTLVTIAWQSDNPAVAVVNGNGQVSARSLGEANIQAVLTTASGVARTSMRVLVVPPGSGSVRFSLTEGGWSPGVVRMPAGTKVTWTMPPLGMSDAAQVWIHLQDMEYRITNSFDIRTGNATLVFARPGRYRFCSGDCWDPSEFGDIEVF